MDYIVENMNSNIASPDSDGSENEPQEQQQQHLSLKIDDLVKKYRYENNERKRNTDEYIHHPNEKKRRIQSDEERLPNDHDLLASYMNETIKFSNLCMGKDQKQCMSVDEIKHLIDINKELEELFLNGGDAYRVQNFFGNYKMKNLCSKHYIANSRNVIYLLVKMFGDFYKDKLYDSLASLNVLLFKNDLSYVYASFCETDNTYEIGVVHNNKNVTYIGHVYLKQLLMIMKYDDYYRNKNFCL